MSINKALLETNYHIGGLKYLLPKVDDPYLKMRFETHIEALSDLFHITPSLLFTPDTFCSVCSKEIDTMEDSATHRFCGMCLRCMEEEVHDEYKN